MSIKLCVLRTGETVIGDLKEVIDHVENKSLGYKISNPYVVTFKYRNMLRVEGEEVEQSEENNADLQFNFWAPLSAERDFNFTFDFIDVIYPPHQDVINSYNAVVNHYVEENHISVEVDGNSAILTYNENLEEAVREINKTRQEEVTNEI